MNIFIGVGNIIDVQISGKVMKFNLSLQQDKPCAIPYILIDPADEIIDKISDFESEEQVVWLQGKISCSEYEYNGRTVKKIVLYPYARSMKPIH